MGFSFFSPPNMPSSRLCADRLSGHKSATSTPLPMKRTRDEQIDAENRQSSTATVTTTEAKRAKKSSAPYVILDNGRLEIPFGVGFVQISKDRPKGEQKKEARQCTCAPPDSDDDDAGCDCGADDDDDGGGDDDDDWDYDLCGARDLRWDLLSERDTVFIEKRATALVGLAFDDLRPVFRDYTGESVVLECDMPPEEADNLDKDEREKKRISGTVAERAALVKYMSFEKGMQSTPPDFGYTIETRAWLNK
ncbi:hypothetical protein pdul_cds_966 [Pandoravirus dulcis]|uniref:Uncharacterized protein n=1 Tax=Pandoravirus dulcis TaxID=1349409 RepID=S4VZD6_9VIRU|nr:hypothetical protein pdul_cds_966 [Pandoravirus dulcis]AGO83219.1 hypothetical protein pdul_cds_966 [Pandoravirus dulcis]